MTILYGNNIVHVDSLNTASNGINCAAYKTCTRCTNVTLQSACIWSIVKQTCYDDTTTINSTESLLVKIGSSCPKYSVDFPSVNISNDNGNFIHLLENVDVVCQLEDKNFTAKVDNHGIKCIKENGIQQTSSEIYTSRYLSIIFNDTRLQFDNVLNHYVYPSNVSYCQKDSYLQCPWDDYRYRYNCWYCVCNACTGNKTYQHCDVRTLENFTYVNLENSSINITCPEAQIKRFQPEYGWRNRSTHIQIQMVDRRMVSRVLSSIIIKVAGRKCSSLSTIKTNGTISCIISPTNDVKFVNKGPVEVTYLGRTNLVIQSKQMFEFGDPVIYDISPTNGSMMGGTLLNINGNFLDVSIDIHAFVGDNLECLIVTKNRYRVQCTTIATSNHGNTLLPEDQVKLLFNNRQVVKSDSRFKYLADPIVDANQTFDGIASGNTTLWVHGQRFTYLSDPIIKVHNSSSDCKIQNDTYMKCRSPPLTHSANLPNQILNLWFIAGFAHQKINITPPLDSAKYYLYPDPTFTDFTIDNCCNITVKGQNLDHGYRAKDDLSIQLVDKNSTECWVILIDSHQITCWINSSNPLPQQIIVKIGENIFKVKIAKKRKNHFPSSFTSVILPSVITITMYVAFITCLCLALLFLKTSTKQYDLMNIYHRQQFSEMRPLNERQRNPDDNYDDKSKNMTRNKIY